MRICAAFPPVAAIATIFAAGAAAEDGIALTRPAATSAAGIVVDPAAREKLAPILKAMSAEDFGVREKAQKDLVELGPEFLPAINEAIEKVKSEEAREGLRGAVDAIYEKLALDPPPISIDLQDVPATDIAAALSKATGKPIENRLARQDDKEAGRITLKLENKPFWQVIGAINEKNPVDVQETGYDRRYLINPSGAPMDLYKNACVQGGFAFVPLGVTHPNPDATAFSMRIAVDPRMRILKRTGVIYKQFVDENGRSLEPVSREGPMSLMRGSVSTAMTPLTVPDRASKKIALVKGEVKYLMMVTGDILEVPDLAKMENKDIELSGYKIRFTEAKVTNGLPSVMFTTFGRAAKPGAPAEPGIDAEFEVYDANGKYVTTVQVSGNGGGGGMKWGGNATFAEPLKGRFVAPTRVKEITVPFTFKDLPLQ